MHGHMTRKLLLHIRIFEFKRGAPAKYAPMSLMMTMEQGSRNQMMPSKMLETKKEEGMKTNSRIKCTQAYWRNWEM